MFKFFMPCVIAAFMGFCPAVANSARFSALGHWMFGIDSSNVYGQRTSDIKDHFQAVQRLRTQFGFQADNGLDGQVQLEIGKTNWGQASSGGALGADSAIIKLRYAYLDWTVPLAGTKVRMGLQPVNMPSFVNGSPLYSEDSAAITISQPVNSNFDITAFWARASSANVDPGKNRLPAFDSMDFFGISLPVRGDNFRWTPYGMFASAGINSYGYRTETDGKWELYPYKSSLRTVATNLAPVGGLQILANPRTANALNPWATSWWAGMGGEAQIFKPWRLAAEAAWGKADFGSATIANRTFKMKRQGWYGAFLAEYKLDWMIPGLLGWFSSGDDDNPWNGSERMPVGKSANRDWKVLNLAYDGAPFCPDGGAQIISPNGTMIGTWGLVGYLKDVTFIKNLTHTLRAGYVRGTNATGMVRDNPFFTDKTPGGYLTTMDEAFEADFETRFNLYENLTLILDMDWLRVNWDKNVWKNIGANLNRDFYRIGFTAYYHF